MIKKLSQNLIKNPTSTNFTYKNKYNFAVVSQSKPDKGESQV